MVDFPAERSVLPHAADAVGTLRLLRSLPSSVWSRGRPSAPAITRLNVKNSNGTERGYHLMIREPLSEHTLERFD